MVAIKGMEIPKNCMDCPLFDGDWGTCNIIGEPKVDATEERAECCPLVEDVVERSKIDKAIEEIKGLIKCSKLPTVNIYNSYSEGLEDCLEILKRNIGESEWKRQ